MVTVIDRAAAIPVAGLPAPRLQLRWAVPNDADEKEWSCKFKGDEYLCFYELVLPLDEHDIRREIWSEGEVTGKTSIQVTRMGGPTKRGCQKAPCDAGDGKVYFDSPYRDGAHARWDAKLLGDLPIFVITPDGLGIAQDSSVHSSTP